jgi:glycosyltransferase involved in cell wall biosynthesis
VNILMADDHAPHLAATLAQRPLGGVETAFALLAAAFERRGHAVRQTRGGDSAPADLVIANRVPRLFARLPQQGRRVLWLHNPAQYLRKPRHAWPLLRARPVLVTLGPSHAATLPWWLPGRRVQIPLAVAPPFDAPVSERAPPPPVAVFTSNPQRGLDWLLRVWADRIAPAVPGAELHLYAGAATYGGDARLAARIAPVLARAAATPGVRLLAPLPRAALREKLLAARCMLYRGDAGETFCLALAEAQAIGLPCVVTPLGAVAERLPDGVVALDEAAFAAAAIRLLRDDAAWTAQHRAALARGPGLSWDAVAAAFEALAA